jgi:regulator of replication initiation timing
MQKTQLFKEDLVEILTSLLDKMVTVETLEVALAPIKQDLVVLKQDVAVLKQDVAVLKQDVAVLKQDVQEIKLEMASLREYVECKFEALAEEFLKLNNVQESQDKTLQILREDMSRKISFKDIVRAKKMLYA